MQFAEILEMLVQCNAHAAACNVRSTSSLNFVDILSISVPFHAYGLPEKKYETRMYYN